MSFSRRCRGKAVLLALVYEHCAVVAFGAGLAAVAVRCWNGTGLTSVMAELVMTHEQRWVDLQRWVEGGLEHALPSTPEAIAAALHEVAHDWSVELIVEVGDLGVAGCRAIPN